MSFTSAFPTKIPLFYKRVILLTFTESIGFTDYGVYSKSIAKTFSEGVGLSEVPSKTITKSFTEAIGFYEYLGYVYPYYDPRRALERLINILLIAKALGIEVELLLENPYIVYLIRTSARKMSGELYA